MRFLKGVILTEAGRTADAIATFSKLTQDYPELPEPYNNLAVLYAAQSEFDKARAALEAAIRANPELRDRAREPRRRVCQAGRAVATARRSSSSRATPACRPSSR